MDLRHYDPALARWVVQDPMTHHEYSPYNAFDNNPVFWADPSGADAERLTWNDIFIDKRGADGLTNEQWIDASRPGINKNFSYHSHTSSNWELRNENQEGSVEVENGTFGTPEDECNECPSPLLYKNGEIIELNNMSYMLFIDNWVQVETQAEYKKRVKDALEDIESNSGRYTDLELKRLYLKAYGHRGIDSQRSNEPMKQAIIQAFGLGSTGKVSEVLSKGIKRYTPWGIIIGGIHGYSKTSLEILKKIKKHDANVDLLRKQGIYPKVKARHYSEFFEF